ncbi:MAG: SIMPL domain-containing protein [Weeksellaceae bacterium]|nr:SIMPL domain-containing protein [Weeksellaceae bacterium]
MKNVKTIIFKLFLTSSLLYSNFVTSQISGNSVYGQKNNSERHSVFNQNPGFSITDNTLTVHVNVLQNQKADKFRIVLGVTEESESVSKSLEKINTRVKNFNLGLTKSGIRKEDIFVDFISQNRIYDYDVDESKRIAKQKTVGFEIKKNIIIEVNNYKQIEEIINKASEYQIFDIIKVDYFNTDIEKIRQKLMDESYKILNAKKEEYQRRFSLAYVGEPKGTENFYSVFPKTQYQEYAAFETSNVDTNYYSGNNFIRKDERKSKTYYYEGVGYSNFDKVINGSDTEIGIQYVVNLTMNFDIKRGK